QIGGGMVTPSYRRPIPLNLKEGTVPRPQGGRKPVPSGLGPVPFPSGYRRGQSPVGDDFRRGDDFNTWFRSRRIAVLLGGTSAERSISLKTGNAIFASLKRQGLHVVAIDAARPLPDALKKNRIDFAYLALHGTGGEDGCVQGLLAWLKIPYTGSGVLAFAAAMDKKTSK